MSAVLHARPTRPLWPDAFRGRPARDAALPALPEVTDAMAMRERLQRLLPQVTDVELVHARHKPGRSCVVEYRVLTEEGDLYLPGRACRADEYPAVLAKTRAGVRRGEEADAADGVHGIDDLGLVLTTFPHDRHVAGLRHLVDAESFKRVVLPMASRFSGDGRWIRAGQSRCEVLTYKPERRALARCVLSMGQPGDRGPTEEVLYARAYSDATGGRVLGVLRELAGSDAFGSLGAPVPRALGHDDAHGILVMEPVPGVSLLPRCRTERFLELCDFAGWFLARLHATSSRPARRHSTRRLLAEGRATSRRLAQSGVAEADGLLDAFARLARGAPGAETSCCVHGDFHPGQVLAATCSFHCVDFDEAGTGDPGIDLGYFVGHLRHLRTLGLLDEPWERAATDAFLAAHRRAGGRVADDVLAGHRALTLLRLALNAVKHLDASWPSIVTTYAREVAR